MKLKISPSRLCGTVTAPPSKSYAHRMLICAALCGGESIIRGVSESEDMLATLDCISAMGAKYVRAADTISVRGCSPKTAEMKAFPCRESGSTLRFMIPPALVCCGSARFTGTPRLLERGIGIYEELLGAKGVKIAKTAEGIELEGRLSAGEYTLRGNVSSQFVSGLMFALPLLDGDSVINVLPPVESRAYIDITVAVLKKFGIEIEEREENRFFVRGSQRYVPCDIAVEGDWSNAAALFALNALGGRLNINGLDAGSIQGDRICLEYIERLRRPGAESDISNCPDLGPVLFALAAASGNGGVFTGTRRLRIKESDRASAMAQELEAFGVKAEVNENSVIIPPCAIHAPERELCSHNDHRIVMALTLMLSITGGIIDGAEAVRKSYPNFFDELERLGLEVSNGA